MSQNNPRPEAWGAERELHVLETLWRCRICTLLLRNDLGEGPQTRLLWGPLGTVGEIHTLLFNGGLYDLVKLTQEQLVMLGLLPYARPNCVRPRRLATGFGASLLALSLSAVLGGHRRHGPRH